MKPKHIIISILTGLLLLFVVALLLYSRAYAEVPKDIPELLVAHRTQTLAMVHQTKEELDDCIPEVRPYCEMRFYMAVIDDIEAREFISLYERGL